MLNNRNDKLGIRSRLISVTSFSLKSKNHFRESFFLEKLEDESSSEVQQKQITDYRKSIYIMYSWCKCRC